MGVIVVICLINLALFAVAGVIVGIAFGVKKIADHARANSTQRQLERIQAEQDAQRMEQERQREAIRARDREAREQEIKRLECEVAIAEAKERMEQMHHEQEKQSERLSKLEAEQRKMRFEIDQINEDLPVLHHQLDAFMEQMGDWQDRLHEAQRALEWDELRMREAPSSVKGKEHDAHLKAEAIAESKIISLEKYIRKAEKQIATAEFKKSEYTRKLEEA